MGAQALPSGGPGAAGGQSGGPAPGVVAPAYFHAGTPSSRACSGAAGSRSWTARQTAPGTTRGRAAGACSGRATTASSGASRILGRMTTPTIWTLLAGSRPSSGAICVATVQPIIRLGRALRRLRLRQHHLPAGSSHSGGHPALQQCRRSPRFGGALDEDGMAARKGTARHLRGGPAGAPACSAEHGRLGPRGRRWLMGSRRVLRPCPQGTLLGSRSRCLLGRLCAELG